MILRLVAVALVLTLVAATVYRVLENRTPDPARSGEGRAMGVKTVPVAVRDFPLVLELAGTVEAAREAALAPQVAGVLARIHVREGQTVAPGAPLFALDARAQEARAAQSRAALTGAEMELAEADKTLARLEPLRAEGFISQQEYDDAVLAQASARARVLSTRSALEAARLEAGFARVVAPFAGRVGRIEAKVGDFVPAGQALTVLTGAGGLDVRAAVPQADWPALEAALRAGGVTAALYSEDQTGPVARGTLAFADNRLDPATGAVPVRIAVSEPGMLLPGQTVRVRLSVGTLPAATVIPDAALQLAQEGAFVFVVREGKAELVRVTPLRRLDGALAVTGALAAGEPVIVEVPRRLRAGGAVTPSGEKPATADPPPDNPRNAQTAAPAGANPPPPKAAP